MCGGQCGVPWLRLSLALCLARSVLTRACKYVFTVMDRMFTGLKSIRLLRTIGYQMSRMRTLRAIRKTMVSFGVRWRRPSGAKFQVKLRANTATMHMRTSNTEQRISNMFSLHRRCRHLGHHHHHHHLNSRSQSPSRQLRNQSL